MEYQQSPESRAEKQEISKFEKVEWLNDAAVNYFISKKKGRYWISITYTNPANPLQVWVREINHYSSYKTAEQYANLFLRGIQRDPRGTKKLQSDAFNICVN